MKIIFILALLVPLNSFADKQSVNGKFWSDLRDRFKQCKCDVTKDVGICKSDPTCEIIPDKPVPDLQNRVAVSDAVSSKVKPTPSAQIPANQTPAPTPKP